MQRLFDIFFALLSIVVSTPLLLPVVLVLLLTGEGEIFYLQNRVGKGGKTFKLYKFATMLKNSPNLGTGTITTKHDPRILPFGRFLRRTKINELPQLFNILIGDMSVIGPRPQTQRCFDAFPDASKNAIKQVTPGLSGIGSIVFRDEEDLLHGQADPVRFYDEVISPYKGALEEWYVANQGLGTYFKLIGVTVWIWVPVLSKSDLVWRAFDTLPKPPAELAKALG
jgi:lipopolysaccharide/colanic/teichoic acid biosynthesis glycosyltransferase